MLFGEFPLEFTNDGIVPVGEGIALDDDLLAHGALDRIAAAVDLRADRFDDDARRRCFIQA
jgi:hypothetical protein